jgi:predicted MPP superfamily phosphohydrolase
MNPGWLLYPLMLYPLWEAAHVRLREMTLEFSPLPEPWDGISLLFISDCHTNKSGRRERLLKRLLNGAETDLLFFGGDLAGNSSGCRVVLSAIEGVKVRIGRYAIRGNSEHLPRVPQAKIERILEENGFTVLVNEHRLLERDGAKLALCGSDCAYSFQSDMEATLDGLPPDVFRILLMHAPEGLLEIGPRRADLILSGHTHGGQLRLPGMKALSVHTSTEVDFDRGVFTASELRRFWPDAPDEAKMVIGTGVGTSTLPIRLFCPPEVLKITLKSSGFQVSSSGFRVPSKTFRSPHLERGTWNPELGTKAKPVSATPRCVARPGSSEPSRCGLGVGKGGGTTLGTPLPQP